MFGNDRNGGILGADMCGKRWERNSGIFFYFYFKGANSFNNTLCTLYCSVAFGTQGNLERAFLFQTVLPYNNMTNITRNNNACVVVFEKLEEDFCHRRFCTVNR